MAVSERRIATAEGLPDSIEGYRVSRHIRQRAKDRKLNDESLINETLRKGERIAQGNNNFRIIYDDEILADTYVLGVVVDGGIPVLKTAYRKH